ncbi:hypothetical protein BZG35_13170 [Brevundimonas sp. LM2]|uniref:AMP-binding protein n=1 Tax=Brevundimonas sp. LM2 TaxID=1938605 RepID=UPI000983CEEE|nr:AMP-binding protein [Brevundimonas sp. LM2]AQR62490.1 hypothetical protein BZG35_13170 [Brevundimonas sp. LM2]
MTSPLLQPAPLASVSDIHALEAAGWPTDLPGSTWALLQSAAERFGEAPALSFFLETSGHRRPHSLSYRDLLAKVTGAANLFHGLGVGSTEVVALVLPNLIETHLCLWGGEAAGVAFPINPLMDGNAIADLLRGSQARAVVTLAPFPGADLYDKVVAALNAPPMSRRSCWSISHRTCEGRSAGQRRLSSTGRAIGPPRCAPASRSSTSAARSDARRRIDW